VSTYASNTGNDRICIRSTSQSGAGIRAEYFDGRGGGYWDWTFRNECTDSWTDDQLFMFKVPLGWKCQSDWGYWYTDRLGGYYTSEINGTLYLRCVRYK
jgi:hypothetical protein